MCLFRLLIVLLVAGVTCLEVCSFAGLWWILFRLFAGFGWIGFGGLLL